MRFFSSSDPEDKDNGSDAVAVEIDVVQENGSTDVAKVGSGEDAPKLPQLIALPCSHRPLFPGFHLTLHITQKDLIDTITLKSRAGRQYVGIFMQENSKSAIIAEPVDVSRLSTRGTFAEIEYTTTMDGGLQLGLVGHRRIKLLQEIPDSLPTQVRVEHMSLTDHDSSKDIIQAYKMELLDTIREILKLSPVFKEQFKHLSGTFDIAEPARLADFAASLTSAPHDELLDLLGTYSVESLLRKSLLLSKKELKIVHIQKELQKDVEAEVAKTQREYFLNEQLKKIKQELGYEKDDTEALIQKFRKRLEEPGISVPQDVQTVIDEEMEKLEHLQKNSSEFSVTRNYLDWLTAVPWGKHGDEVYDIAKTKATLDRDHHGLNDIKDRILEFVAVCRLKGLSQGKILCFSGPPGTGKTSIGKSIAHALNREFYRFSVGGLSDVSEIKGHRRTYVGAMPGKIIQCLKTTGTSNPVILIDEIDKLGRGYQGDPASALLELLDPNQNDSFIDHYLDTPVDLSKVLFICTANVEDTIPGPLLDRMDILRLSGYDLPEKRAIARDYLIPKAREATGLTGEDSSPTSLLITDDSLDRIIKWYCREAGVRHLEKEIEKICRKVARKVVSTMDSQEAVPTDFVVEEDQVEDYIGKPLYTSKRLFAETPPGVVMGLAWTAMGGTSLYIEAVSPNIKKDGQGSMKVTGNIKDVMKESASIAHTYARLKLANYQSNNKFLEESDLHLHVPEGATPKDGPSAGCTMVTALLSLALARAVRPNLAMTGEVTLTGRVLAVGGIKEKVIGARREGVTCLVLPESNKRDWDELSDYHKEGLEVHFASEYDDVFDVAFCEDRFTD